MNYLAHGWSLVDDPAMLAGVATPDWLRVSDPRIRAPRRLAQPLVDDSDPLLAGVARGVVRHHDDDAWFHATRAFAETSLELSRRIRLWSADDDSLRPSFLGHILVELLLDAILTSEEPDRLAAYYAALDSLNVEQTAAAIGRVATRPPERLAWFIGKFCEVRFLYDYLDDQRLTYRLNQVLARVRLPALPERFAELLPAARQLVADRRRELLTPP